MNRDLVVGIETGGTKILARACAIRSGETVAEGRWETGPADRAVSDLTEFLSNLPDGSNLAAIGMAAFGPLIVDPNAPDYGRMLATPKPGWARSNLRAELEHRFSVPVGIDTDVNAAAIAEQELGAGAGLPAVAYVTVGTGIGAGLAIEGRSLKGAMHPEAGHIRLVRRPGDRFESACPFHADCAEGLVAGPAIHKRLGEGRDLADDRDLIDLVAGYLGQLGAALVLAWSPCRIVWGGGILNAAPLVPLIAEQIKGSLGGYGVGPAVDRSDFCVPAALEDAGLEGALLLARQMKTQAAG